MPHKKNPDVFELIRAKCNKIQSLVVEFAYVTNNLPTGYHRDFQLLKESLFAGIDELNSCLEMGKYMLAKIKVSSDILIDEKYDTWYEKLQCISISTNICCQFIQREKKHFDFYKAHRRR